MAIAQIVKDACLPEALQHEVRVGRLDSCMPSKNMLARPGRLQFSPSPLPPMVLTTSGPD